MATLAPKVTGISPKEGPPRTKLTIRGENFGINQFDLISVKICDIECLIFSEWITPQKIITKSPNCIETGPIIITTKSGGTGTSMIQFRALEQPVGLTTPSGVWIDENNIFPFDSGCSTTALITNDGHTKVPMKSQQNDILSDSFNPSIYLVENHKNSSFEELKKEYKTQLEKNRSEPENTLDSNTFLKANIVSIMDCLNALNALYLSFKKDRQEFGSDLTVKIDDYIKSANDEAHAIFDNIISRKDDADSMRNALNVLQRYRFLFNLPSNIDKSMQRKDYDVVINDFFRAKNLFSDSSVSVFRKVFIEVEQRIQSFILTLRELFKQCALNLEDNNIDELKKLIKYLSSLEENADPAWDAILLIKQSLFDKINECRQQYLSSQASNDSKTLPPSNPDNSPQKPPQVLFIDKTSRLFDRIFNDLFKLGCAYLNGDLYNKTSMDDLKRKREIFEKDLLAQSIKLLCNEYRNVLLPDANSFNYTTNQTVKEIDQDFVLWLPYCLRSAVQCYSNLLKLDFNLIHIQQNSGLLKPMQTFIFDLRLYTLTCLFTHKSNDVKNLYKKEVWNIEFDDIYGVRTNLPLQFETKVIEILQLIRDSVIQIRTADEIDIFTQINVKGLIKQLIQSLINSFLYALERSAANPISSNRNITEDNRSLIVLCNCSYTASYVLPKLYEIFEKYSYPDMAQVIQLTQKKFKDLESKLLDTFIERKRDDVIGGIETSMRFFDENWFQEKEMPKDVSYYIKETILNLIYVQSEIYKITPQLVYKTMFEILLATVIEIERLCASYSKQLSDAARIQMLVDINAIEHVFRKTGNDFHLQLQPRIDNCRDLCQISIQDQTIRKLIDDVTGRFCTSMRLQISCFNFNYDNGNVNLMN
ncbi:exocyst complex component 2-like protein [Euroglyphus maynei]|uniref:Exocyst complex component 2 n=1 Tax=Euroglyphus maynei TaxID=6958 RepID=A0A1Y3B147_EURMA|nr:exocyst complex component 2-like protein [Euroglyphus maynei]